MLKHLLSFKQQNITRSWVTLLSVFFVLSGVGLIALNGFSFAQPIPLPLPIEPRQTEEASPTANTFTPSATPTLEITSTISTLTDEPTTSPTFTLTLTATSTTISSLTPTLTSTVLGIPVLNAPCDQGSVIEASPKLQWYGTDFATEYKIVVIQANTYGSVNPVSGSQKKAIIDASTCDTNNVCGADLHNVFPNLRNGKTYQWRVVAKDNQTKEKSEKWRFTLNEPWKKFVVYSPLPNSTRLPSELKSLRWQYDPRMQNYRVILRKDRKDGSIIQDSQWVNALGICKGSPPPAGMTCPPPLGNNIDHVCAVTPVSTLIPGIYYWQVQGMNGSPTPTIYANNKQFQFVIVTETPVP